MKKYRNNGAIGAIMDEYERAIIDLKEVTMNVSNIELCKILDSETMDKDCVSIQSILDHVVRSGYGYANAIRRHQGETSKTKDFAPLMNVEAYNYELDKMLTYTESLFEDYPEIKFSELDNSKKMLVSWGQLFDVEQLMEHAIVHVLLHRRQIEKFIPFL